MSPLQVRYTQRAKINRCSLNTRMPKNPRQHVNIPARRKPLKSKRVTKSVRRKSNTRDTQLLPEYLEIPFKIPNGDLCIVLRAVQHDGTFWSVAGAQDALLTKRPQPLPKFVAEGYQPMLATLTDYPEGHIVEVNVFFRKTKNLTRTKASVKNRKRNKVSSGKVDADGPVANDFLEGFW